MHNKYKIILISISISIVTLLSLLMLYLIKRPDKEYSLNNIALCYHSITANESDKALYVTYIEDFIAQINHLKSKGYTFVLPSKYNEWYTNKYEPRTPIATIMFDDARDSVSIASDWLIKNKIPFGIAVIGRKLRSYEAEKGYMNWSTLKTIMKSGYCELLYHSYNIHNYDLYLENSTVVSAPIMEGPSYLDNGEFLYIDTGDLRWYWDMSHVDDISWAFPLLGTDISTGKPITSTIVFKARENFTATKIRVWASLHYPISSGYDATIKIDINGYEVANKVIDVADYNNRIQWTEREFITIDFDRSFNIEADKNYTITFTTLNAGDSALLIYSIPDFTGNYQLTTTCNKMTYGANEVWPAKACMIIAGDNGKQVGVSEFIEYVTNDMIMNNKVINRYLNAKWTANTTGYTDNDSLESIVLGGTYSDGRGAKTNIKYVPDRSYIGEVLRLKYASHLGEWYPLIIDIYVNDTKVARYLPNWEEWSWQTIDITPYNFTKGKEYTITFKTMNKNSHGLGLIRILTDQKNLPWPKWDKKAETWKKPSDLQFQHEISYEVNSPEGSDIYPDDIQINGIDYTWEYNTPFTGPGKAFLEILSCKSKAVTVPKQICYPFGAYYAQTSNGKEDLNPVLKSIFESVSIDSGYAIWGEGVSSTDNVKSQYSNYIIPRYMIEGDMELSQVLENFDILTGSQKPLRYRKNNINFLPE